MKTLTHAALAVTLLASQCLYSACAAADDASQDSTQPRENPVKSVIGDIEADYKKADAQHEDVVDRAFAPLDDTVSDINRDLNDGADDSAIPPSSD